MTESLVFLQELFIKDKQNASVIHLLHQQVLSTVYGICCRICAQEDVDWVVKYEFVFDRLRAVRQDLTILSIADDSAVYILENCVRFYLISISK